MASLRASTWGVAGPAVWRTASHFNLMEARMTLPPVDHEALTAAVVGGAAAIRSRTRLQPAGGQGNKVFPPTFGDPIRITLLDGSQNTTRYAVELRRIDGRSVTCVILVTFASQADPGPSTPARRIPGSDTASSRNRSSARTGTRFSATSHGGTHGSIRLSCRSVDSSGSSP
jgi:hypothetical protein